MDEKEFNELVDLLERKAEQARKKAVEEGDLTGILQADLDLRNLEWVRTHPNTFDSYCLLINKKEVKA